MRQSGLFGAHFHHLSRAVFLLGIFLGYSPAALSDIVHVFFAGGQSNATQWWFDGLANTLAARYKNFVLVSDGHSGASLSQWYDNGPQANYASDFYNASGTGALQVALSDILANGDTYRFDGFFWFQGETDAGSAAAVGMYDARFHSMLGQIRTDLNLDQFHYVLAVIDANRSLISASQSELVDALREIQFGIGDEPMGQAFDTAAYNRVDAWHIDGNSARRLGNDMAAAYIAAIQRPNVILFLVDDMGWQDTSLPFYDSPTVFNSLYHTPNMEKLAARGMKFTNAYSDSPVCSPTRVSIMTGKNPARTRVSDWVGDGISQNSYVRSPSWAATGLQPGDGNFTLPTILEENGYRSAHVGKAHFGGSGTAGADPVNLGFEINIGGSYLGNPPQYFGPFPQIDMPGLGAYGKGAYLTDALTTEANKIIDQAVVDGVPFFINMAHYAVHTPLDGQGDPRFLGNYLDRPNPEDDYASMLESMDASLGVIMDRLEADGIADNTIIVFMSDNGGLSAHTRSDIGDPWIRNHHNAPLFSGKASAYEGGLRVPMVVAWAGQPPDIAPINGSLPITPGSVSDTPVSSADLFTTILSMAGVQNLEQYTHDQGKRIVDGYDLTPILNGSGTFRRDGALFFHYPHQTWGDIGFGPGIEPFSAVRDGDFKLIYFYGDGKADGQGPDPRIELYNLADDIGEQNNLASTHPIQAFELESELVQFLQDVNAQVPVIRATGVNAELPQFGDLTNDANAGPDQTVFVTDTVRLDGSASSDVSGNPLAYFWTITTRPVGSQSVLSDPAAVNPTFIADESGTYVVQLIVNNGEANSVPDAATINTVIPQDNVGGSGSGSGSGSGGGGCTVNTAANLDLIWMFMLLLAGVRYLRHISICKCMSFGPFGRIPSRFKPGSDPSLLDVRRRILVRACVASRSATQ